MGQDAVATTKSSNTAYRTVVPDQEKTDPTRLAEYALGAAVLCIWLSTIGAYGVQLLTSGRSKVIQGKELEVTAFAAHFSTGTKYLALCAVIIAVGIVLPHARVSRWQVIFSLPWVVTLLTTLVNDGGFSQLSLIFPLSVFAAGSVDSLIRPLRATAVIAVLTATISLALGIWRPGLGLTSPSVADPKGIIGDHLLAGMAPSGNSLAIALFLASPTLRYIRARRVRIFSIVVVVTAILWSGSRTSLGAGAAIVVVWFAIRIVRRYHDMVKVTYLGACMVAVVGGPYLVWRNYRNPDAFTGRGSIWYNSLQFWHDHEWWGNGANFYAEAAKTTHALWAGYSSAFHGHSLFVNTLTISGLFGLLAISVLLLHQLRNGYRFIDGGDLALGTWPLMFLLLGWLEVATDYYNSSTAMAFLLIPSIALVAGPQNLKTHIVPRKRDLKASKSSVTSSIAR